MISFEIFLIGLGIVSTLTSLVTEAVKKILIEHNVNYCANTLTGIIAAILSIAIGIGYIVIANVGFTSQSIVCIIALAFISWLCSMIGYDKVIQVINQFKNIKKG